MLWVALHFPQLRRQALSRGHALPEPEQEALAALAAWSCQFTPRVSLEPPQALLMEVEGSLRHFGGIGNVLDRLRAGLTSLGFEADLALASTARAALWRAAGGGGELKDLPVEVVTLGPKARELLPSLGVRTLDELMRLPREGVARRFGQDLVDQVDQAYGRISEPREFFVPPPSFSARLELLAPVMQADNALFAARRLLAQMEGFLAARHAGVRGFSLDLVHDSRPATLIQVGLATPGRDAEHFTRLLRERLARTTLCAAVEAIRLEAGNLEFLPGENKSFFSDSHAGGEEWLRLVERLQARLGSDAVYGLGIHQDHRPELAWGPVSLGQGSFPKEESQNGPRPIWLLNPPRRLREGEFVLLAGPERIESGWWDGADARRDYFIARTGEGSMAWIYREREGSWLLHGLFA